jgi:Putative zinc-finger
LRLTQGGPVTDFPTEGHPEPALLAAYVHGELGREPRRELERHLAVCGTCQAAVDAIPVPAGAVRWEGHRFTARRLEHERRAEREEVLNGVLGALGGVIAKVSRGELSELLAADQLKRRTLIRDEPRFWSLPLCDMLMARCRAVWSGEVEDPEAAVESAKLAVLIAERAVAAGGGDRAEDVRAMALVHLGSCYRVAAERRNRPPESQVAEPGAPGTPGTVAPSGLSWEGESALWELRDAFLKRRMGFAAILVCLDLALAFLRAGREGDVRRLVDESIPVFEEHGADPYVVDALRFLGDEKLREGRAVTPELVRSMASFLEEARNDPRNVRA